MLLQEKQNRLERDEREGGKVIDMKIEKKKQTRRTKEEKRGKRTSER